MAHEERMGLTPVAWPPGMAQTKMVDNVGIQIVTRVKSQALYGQLNQERYP